MAPFRNKGWAHFDKISEIIPNANARGSYAFSPMNATAPTSQLVDDEAVAQAVAETATTSGYNELDFDKDGDGMTLISTAASKLHKIPPTTVGDNDDTITFNSGFPPPPSTDAISNSISNPTSPGSNPTTSNSTSGFVSLEVGSRKTRSTPAESRSGLLPRAAGPSRRTKTSRRSSNNPLNAKGEPSSSILVHNMQGSINMLTATVRDSVAIDPITKVRQDAVRLVQKEEGLSSGEQITLFQLFADKHSLAQTYLAIEAADLRLEWLKEILKDV
jgi:hypothetical protein